MKKIKTFKGTSFEIGKQKGEIYKKNGMSFKDIIIEPKLFKKQLHIYKKYYPEILEELKGVAAGGEFPEDKVIYNFITGELRWFTKSFGLKRGCTIFGVKNGENLFVGRNYDWHPATEKVFEVFKQENSNRNNFVAVSDMGIVSNKITKKDLFYMPEDIINDKGLYLGITMAFNDKWSYGLSFKHMLGLIAETCTTVKDAINVFKKVPLCCPKNFFIADAFGDMIAIEHTSKRFKIVKPKDNVLIQTNHYVDSDLAKEDKVLKLYSSHRTFIRYYEALQRINERKEMFSYKNIMEVIGNKDTYVCQNRKDHPVKSVWSLALDMKNRKYKLHTNLFGKRKSLNFNI